jgi:DnaJ-class molecular chaperone
MKVNYYEVLGVDRTASEQQIRDRFRTLARENHPDRYRGTDKAAVERKFQTLTEAVNVLTNAEKRKQHDAEITSTKGGVADFVQIAKAYLAQGAKAFNAGDIKTAYEQFDLAAKHNPQDSKAFHYLARAAAKIRGYERQAVQAIESAVQREPMNPVYLKDAGVICKNARLNAKAERYFEECLKWDPSNAEAQAALSELRGTKEAGKGGFSIFGKR